MKYKYDSNNMIHSKDSDGYKTWCEYDGNNMIYYKNSNGLEIQYTYKESN